MTGVFMKGKKLSTFKGVYTPTVLTILGVILYLRMGWIVGNAGLAGTVIIIILAHVITVTTALSMSSNLTNMKIGKGGAYAVITRTLGHEMGGAIGIPLFLSQAISVAFYISGFTELWVTFFPNHPQIVIGIITWVFLTGISLKSTELAFKIQYGILLAVGLSLISFLIGPSQSQGELFLLGKFTSASFWQTFAIFFPAVTGILTGAAMSGELENPSKSIIKGTLTAIITGFIVYLLVAYGFAVKASEEVLIGNPSVIFDVSRFKILIILGIMGAVLSSALSTLVSAPRTLSALAENRIVPFSLQLSQVNKKGEPIKAVIFSSIISLLAIVSGNLDSLAELLTMFFLTTYAMINLIVLFEKLSGIISYRPTIELSVIIPVLGLFGCIGVMLLINPIFTLIAFFVIACIYILLKRKSFTSPWGDVRGGMFISITEWAAQKAASLPYHARLWKPSVVVPVEKPEDFKRILQFTHDLVYPSGRVYYLTSIEEPQIDLKKNELIDSVLEPLKESHIFVQKIVVTSNSFKSVVYPILQCLMSSFLPPNIVLFTISKEAEKQKKLQETFQELKPLKISMILLWIHPKYNFGLKRKIYMWLRKGSPNNDLGVLCALKLAKNYEAEINLCRIVENEEDIKGTEKELIEFINDARLPANTKIKVYTGDFYELIANADADMHIFGLPYSYGSFSKIISSSSASILFVSSSGVENAML